MYKSLTHWQVELVESGGVGQAAVARQTCNGYLSRPFGRSIKHGLFNSFHVARVALIFHPEHGPRLCGLYILYNYNKYIHIENLLINNEY